MGTRGASWRDSKASGGEERGWARIVRAFAEPEPARDRPPAREGRAPATPSGFYLLKEPEQRGLRILLVLQDAELSRVARRQLRRLRSGMVAIHAIASIDDAIASLRARTFDVVVTDAPRGDDGLLRLASAAAAHGEVPIVVVGDDAELDAAAAACRAGAHAYLARGELGERALARAVVCAHERARQVRRLVDDAHRDELTRVANRRPLRARFAEMRHRALHHGGDVACLVVDLDGFKRINDTFGHHVGDEVLAAVAARLLAHVRATDLVARLGGDEFAVLLDGVEHGAYGEIVERIERILAEPLAVDGSLVPVSASVGLGRGRPDEVSDLGALLRRADADMYRKKTRRAGSARTSGPTPR
jgi:diguanylate cyclase (GGDEF)-like protein